MRFSAKPTEAELEPSTVDKSVFTTLSNLVPVRQLKDNLNIPSFLTKNGTDNDGDGMAVDNSDSEGQVQTEQSWDVLTTVNSVTSMATAMTNSTQAYFGLSSHPAKGENDLTIDAFMDSKGNDSTQGNDKGDIEAKYPIPVPKEDSKLHASALNCIERNDFESFLKIIKENPSLLLYQCKRQNFFKLSNDDKDGEDAKGVRGCHGGTLVHVLVSQKPKLRKKKLAKKNGRNEYDVHIMPSIPECVLAYVIKKCRRTLRMVDDYGRLPIHCAVLSLSSHLEEMSKLYGNPDDSEDIGTIKRVMSRFVVRELNLMRYLIKYNSRGASTPDGRGNLPLHYAVMMMPDYIGHDSRLIKVKRSEPPSAKDTVKRLLDSYPKGIGIKNNNGQLPIHVICSRGYRINQSCLHLILSEHSLQRGLPLERDLSGDPPLYIAIKNGASHRVIKTFASIDHVSGPCRIFTQCDKDNNNPLHVVLGLSSSSPNLKMIYAILSEAPFTASTPNGKGIMPIKLATKLRLPDNFIRQILARDLPIEIGSGSSNHAKGGLKPTTKSFRNKSIERSRDSRSNPFYGRAPGVAKHIVGRSHHHSWWHVLVECEDRYINMIYSFLSEEATHSQIVTLARIIGPDGKSILISCMSSIGRIMFHSLLRFYDRYEILLSSNEKEFHSSKPMDGLQIFHAIDHGPSSPKETDDLFASLLENIGTSSKAVKVNETDPTNSETTVEVSLLTKDKAKVLLRCYHYEDAFHAELKVRHKYKIPATFIEEIHSYHRDEYYSHLTLAKAEKLCCIAFERPDHTLDEVFGSISNGTRSQKWIEKCWVVLKQIATAVKSLHERNLIHGHLSAKSIAKYGNTWKLTNVGTVTPIGNCMRGLLRPCAPPESITVSYTTKISSSKELNPAYRKQSQKSVKSVDASSPNRVKFSSSFEFNDEKPKKNKLTSPSAQKQSRDDTNSTMTNDQDTREGEGDASRFSSAIFDLKSWMSRSQDEVEVVAKLAALSEENTKASRRKFKSERASFTPEIVKASPTWDIWSFGLVMVQLLLGKCMHLPNFEKADDAVLKKLIAFDNAVLKHILDRVYHVAGLDAADLISKLLRKNPRDRPKNMEEVLNHQYFQVLTIYVN